jgi:GAF domain-containing protein
MKDQLYTELYSEIKALINGVRNPISNYANVSAAIFNKLPNLNWVGFYFLYENELSLGPFQGKPACVSIPLGKGVCGTAMQEGSTVLVKDVHQFPGHIACDAASNSEIVIPLIKNGIKIGVLDIDSPIISRFDKEDQQHLEEIVDLIMNNLE